MPIIRITKAQIEKANKARKAALRKDLECRAFDELQQLRRDQAVSKQNEQIKDADKRPKSALSMDRDFRPCNERQREREAVVGEEEQHS